MAEHDITRGALRALIVLGLFWLAGMSAMSGVSTGAGHAWTWYAWIGLTFVALPSCGLAARNLHLRRHRSAPLVHGRERDELHLDGTVVRLQTAIGIVELVAVTSAVVAIAREDKPFPDGVFMASMLLLVGTRVYLADRGEAVKTLRSPCSPSRRADS